MKSHTSLFNVEKKILSLLIAFFLPNIAINAQANENLTITALFQNSYKVYKDIRKPNGVYLDALALNGAPDKPAAIVANGIGLISLSV